MIPVLTFDIETVPDTTGIRRLYGLKDDELSDTEVAELAVRQRRQVTGSDFLPHYLHRVAAIACVLRSDEGFRVWSLGSVEADEGEIIRRFFEGIERYTPQLVSWNGGGFDLPVLHYRALMHGIEARRYWEMGDDDREFRFNHYLGRYHTRHLDLMDVLSMYQARATAPLDSLAQLLGFPGKLGMDGSKVWEAFQGGDIAGIRNYCETDTVNTYLVYLRFQRMRGHLPADIYGEEMALVRAALQKNSAPHWHEFLSRWPEPN